MTQPISAADPDIDPPKPGLFSRISVIWLVPVLALVVSLGVAWQSYSARGPLIEITFETASGISAGKTEVKYRDVTIGMVEDVSFTPDLSRVQVAVRVQPEIAPYLDDDAQFWVVTPQVSVRGISGLSTVLSGVYIEGTWDSVAGAALDRFTALKDAPLTRNDQTGTTVVLRAPDSSQMSAGAPILHKGIEVGYIEKPRLSTDGDAVLVTAFIEAPFNSKLTTATRFWDTSGFDVSLGAGGVRLNVNSLASLLEGGISFETLVSGGTPVTTGQEFTIYTDEESARSSLFETPDEERLQMSVLLDGSISGLTEGSDVQLRGLKIGSVTGIGTFLVEQNGRQVVRMRANIALNPARLGLGSTATATEAIELLQGYVTEGLRARLATANILSGALMIELVTLPTAPPAGIDLAALPYPLLPSSEANLSDFNATAEGVFERINALPIEELLGSAINLINGIERIATNPATQQAPETMVGLLEDARALLGAQGLQDLPAQLETAMISVNVLLSELQTGQTVASLTRAIDSAGAAAASFETAAADFPEITAQIKDLAAKANSLAVEDLLAATTQTLQSVDALIDTQAAREMPAALSAALDEIRLFLGEVRAGGAITNVNAALASAQSAADAVAQAATSLPALAEQIDALVREASGVMGTYGAKSRFNADTLSMLNDISEAADAVTALTRAIQRNPNSLILGR